MSTVPAPIARFLEGKRIAVVGLTAEAPDPARAIAARLAATGHEVVPVSREVVEFEGHACYPALGAVAGPLDGAFVAPGPAGSLALAAECVAAGVPRIWFHWTIGEGHVPEETRAYCAEHGVECIDGGCPLMFCPPVDPFHRCLCWVGQRTGHVPR